MNLKGLLHDVLNICFPRKCPVCGGRLFDDECICVDCLLEMPYANLHFHSDNRLVQRFSCRVPVVRAGCYFYYSPESPYHQIVHRMKYRGDVRLCVGMGRLMATHIGTESDFFADVDVLIPIPLHKRREEKRGYNQSLLLAQGMSEVLGIPVDSNIIVRIVDNPTQTHLSDTERWENVQKIFQILPVDTSRLEGKHLLLVDDVTTTGATLTSCAEVLHKSIPQCRISVAVLGLADMGVM